MACCDPPVCCRACAASELLFAGKRESAKTRNPNIGSEGRQEPTVQARMSADGDDGTLGAIGVNRRSAPEVAPQPAGSAPPSPHGCVPRSPGGTALACQDPSSPSTSPH